MKDIEIEIQARVESVEGLMKFLQDQGTFVSEKQQMDEYFVPAHRDFLAVRPIEEWFRLRNETDHFSINYKKWHYDEKGIGTYADEYETRVESIETTRKILAVLDCKSICVVDKTRKKWMYENFEVALDTVKGLGSFVEVEYKGKEAVDHKQVTAHMIQFLKDHGCGKIELNNGGYPNLLLFPQEAQYIQV